MRALVIALVLGSTLVSCGGSKSPGTATTPAAVAAVFPAARWVPAEPTYVVSARTMRDAQASFTHLFEMLGMSAGFEVSELSRDLASLLGVDPLSPDALAGLGIDLEGSVALFSEDVNPTFVVHLTNADAMQSFLDGQRARGIRTQSVISNGTEVYTAKLAGDAHVSWAVEKEWLWVHFAFDGADGIDWFESSKEPDGAAWVDGWSWAKALAGQAAPVIGVLDPGGFFASLGAKASDAIACGKQFAAVKRVGLSFDVQPKSFGVKLALDLGDAAVSLRSRVLPPPPGWANASANAPVAAQWNIDLPTAVDWLEVCTGDDDFRIGLGQVGIRSIRGFAHALDIGDKEGVGAISADLTTATFFRSMLDQIPGRSMAESSRAFGQYQGKHVKVPFFIEADYVLTDTLVIGAMGEGVLAKVGTGAPVAEPPAMVVELRPQGMSAGVWQELLELVGAPDPKRLAQRLMLWTELHLGATLDGNALVIDARGIRR